MNLNKAMVDLYKQRGSASMKSRGAPNKAVNRANGSTADELEKSKTKLTDSMLHELDASESLNRKLSKIEEAMALMDFKPKTRLDELFGMEKEQGEILLHVNKFNRAIKGHSKKSKWPVPICGSRGLGKTALVEAAANHAELKLIPIQLSQMIEMTRNEFKETIEQLIRYSIANEPAIVLFDDIEKISDKDECKYLVRGAMRRLLEEQRKLLLFCTTSSTPDCIPDMDFSKFEIHLRRPTSEARYKILASLRQENENLVNLSDDCLQVLATNTPSFTALDLQEMLDIAETVSDGKPTLRHCDTAVQMIKKSFRRGTHLIGERPTVTWQDIGGMSNVKQEFKEILQKIRRRKARPGETIPENYKFAGIALHGPPGCGKTMVAQAMANEAGFNFISIKPAELVEKYLGETEKNIRRVFLEAREHEPCMIYFDEFDGLCGTRGNRDNITGAIQTLLSEMDGFAKRGQSLILVSTNRMEDIDPAMKRPGRLTEHIYVGPPDQAARRDILAVITNKPWIVLDDSVDLDFWASSTDNFTGAELDFLIAEAEAKATSESSATDTDESNISDEQVTIKGEHLEYAFNKIRSTNKELNKKTRSHKRPKRE